MRFLIFIFLLPLSVSSLAQPRIDSLKQELQRVTDVGTRAILTNKIAESLFLSARYDSLGKYGGSLLEFSRQMNDQSLELLARSYQAQSFMRVDSARFFRDSQLMLATCEKNSFVKGIAINCLGLGSRLLTLGKYKQALEFLIKGYNSIDERDSLTGFKSDLIRTVSAVHHHQGNYTEALEYGLEGSRLAEQSKDQIQILKSYLNLSGLYGELSSPDNGLGTSGDRKRYAVEAKKYMILSYKFSLTNASLLTQGATAFNLGSLYVEAGQTDSAWYYLDVAIRLGHATNFSELLSNAYRMKSRLYPNQPDSAVYFLDHAYEYADQAQNPVTRIVASLEKARVWMKQKKWLAAEKLANESLVAAQDLNSLNDQRAAYLLLSELKTEQHMFREALTYYQKYNTVKDSIINEKNFARIEELRTKYETDLKDSEINFLEQKTVLQELEIRQKNYVLIGVLVVAILIAGFIFLYFRQRTILQQKKALDIENRFLRFQLDPHFLSNALVSIQRFMLENNSTQASTYLAKFARLMRQLLEYSREELITLEEEIDLLRNYLDLQKLRFKESFEYDLQVAVGLEITEVRIAPMFAQPFVENAIEHGVSKIEQCKIAISFAMLGDRLRIVIEDNGSGFVPHSTSEQRSLSTTIIRERMELFNRSSKTPMELELIQPHNGTGMKVQLLLPIYL